MQNYECRIVSSRTGRDHSHPSWAESGANGGVKSEAEEYLLLRERNDSVSLGLVWPGGIGRGVGGLVVSTSSVEGEEHKERE